MRLQMILVFLATIVHIYDATSVEDLRVKELIQEWAPLVWLAPGERFLPLGVPEFLDNMEEEDNHLSTRLSLQSLLQNRSSFLHGRKPAGNVPIYALVKSCGTTTASDVVASSTTTTVLPGSLPPEIPTWNESTRLGDVLVDDLGLKSIETNSVPGSQSSSEFGFDPAPAAFKRKRQSHARPTIVSRVSEFDDIKRLKLKYSYKPVQRNAKKHQPAPHFHVTYWMFYPFSEGKAVCVLDLGFLGSWPIPSWGGVCLGKLKEYGSHVGDWEHVSLFFKGTNHPVQMYVSAHDAGAFYRYDPRSNTFVFESQETRSGLFQKPTFPERVFTSDSSHPILFSARGSHGLWTAPGKHKFVRIPRLYDESGFGTIWPTWRKVEMLSAQKDMPGWMSFTGKWGNKKSNCHPLSKIGFNICEFVDGPTGIPMKKMNFKC